MKSNIRKLRNEKNISQTTLADILGKTQQTVSHMERDRNRIPIESLITLSDYFGVSTDYILGVGPKGTDEEMTDIQAGLQGPDSETPAPAAETGSVNSTPGNSRRMLFELILSFLLYSLEDDARDLHILQEESI